MAGYHFDSEILANYPHRLIKLVVLRGRSRILHHLTLLLVEFRIRMHDYRV